MTNVLRMMYAQLLQKKKPKAFYQQLMANNDKESLLEEDVSIKTEEELDNEEMRSNENLEVIAICEDKEPSREDLLMYSNIAEHPKYIQRRDAVNAEELKMEFNELHVILIIKHLHFWPVENRVNSLWNFVDISMLH